VKIYSKEKDFYDGVASMDREPLPIYRREKVERKLDDNESKALTNDLTTKLKLGDLLFNRYFNDTEFNITPIIVGFCGEIYHCIKANPRYQLNRGGKGQNNDLYIYSQDQMDKLVLFNKKLNSGAEHYRESKSFECVFKFDKYAKTLKDNKFLKELFYNQRCPYFSITGSWNKEFTLTLNPNLKELEFQKFIDPYTTYQELDMFMSNQLSTDSVHPIMPVGTDVVIAESKGFNKASFRSEKQTKKRRK